MWYTGSVDAVHRLGRCGTQAQQMRFTGSVNAVHRLCSYGSQAQYLQLTGSVALQHVGSSWTRDPTCIPCIGSLESANEPPGKSLDYLLFSF